jgi:hypothetical protein
MRVGCGWRGPRCARPAGSAGRRVDAAAAAQRRAARCGALLGFFSSSRLSTLMGVMKCDLGGRPQPLRQRQESGGLGAPWVLPKAAAPRPWDIRVHRPHLPTPAHACTAVACALTTTNTTSAANGLPPPPMAPPQIHSPADDQWFDALSVADPYSEAGRALNAELEGMMRDMPTIGEAPPVQEPGPHVPDPPLEMANKDFIFVPVPKEVREHGGAGSWGLGEQGLRLGGERGCGGRRPRQQTLLRQVSVCACTHARMDTCARRCTAPTRIRMHRCTRTHTHTRTHARAHTRRHAHAHARTHARTHTHMAHTHTAHTHTHTHMAHTPLLRPGLRATG